MVLTATICDPAVLLKRTVLWLPRAPRVRSTVQNIASNTAPSVQLLFAGVPQEKAVNVVHSQVAAQVRNLIIAACAGTRSQDSTANLLSLLACVHVTCRY